VSHKRGGRLPLLSARPAVTPTTLKRAATNFADWWTEAGWVWTVCLRLLPDSVATAIWTQAFCAWVQHANHSATEPPNRWTVTWDISGGKQPLSTPTPLNCWRIYRCCHGTHLPTEEYGVTHTIWLEYTEIFCTVPLKLLSTYDTPKLTILHCTWYLLSTCTHNSVHTMWHIIASRDHPWIKLLV